MSACSRLGLHLRQLPGLSVPRTSQVRADVVDAPLQARKVETWEATGTSSAAPQVAAGGQPEGASEAGKAQPDLQWLLPSKPKHYTSLITACGTLTELQAVCWTYHTHLTPIQISAAFTTCVRIVTGHGNTTSDSSSSSSSSYVTASREAVQLVGWLLDRLSRQRASCSSREVANALWCLAKLRHHPGPVYIDTLLDHFLDVLPTSSSQGISMTLYALAQLQHVPSEAWLAQVIPALTRAASAEAAAGTQPAQALSNSCWALATLEAPGASHWVCELLGCAVALAERAQQQQQQRVAAAARASKHLLAIQSSTSPAPSEQEGDGAHGGAPGAAASTVAGSSSPSEGVTKARAALQHLLQQAHLPQEPPPPPSPTAIQGIQPQAQSGQELGAQAAAGSIAVHEALSSSSSSQQVEVVLAPLGIQAVANMAWAAAAVVQKEGEAARWAGPSQQQQQSMQWQEPGGTLTGGSRLALVGSVARQVGRLLQLSAAAGRLQQANPSELAMLVWGAGRLNLSSMSPGWWSAFLPATLQQLQARPWSAQELATLLRGCVRCRVRPPLLWMQAFCAASAPALPGATLCEVSVMVWALGKWGYAPPASWVGAALQRVGQQLPLASSNHLGMLLFGLSRLRYRPQEELVRGLLQRLYDTIPATRDPHILSATLYALQRMQLTPGRDLLRRLVDTSCHLLGTIRCEDLVLLLGCLAELQPAPRVSPGQLWVSLEKERALVQHRIELLRQRMAALQAEEAGQGPQQQQQQQQQQQGGQQPAGSRAGPPGLVAQGLVGDPPAAHATTLPAARGAGRGADLQEGLWQLEGQQAGGWLMAGLDDMPPPPVLMQSYLEVMEEEEDEDEEEEAQHPQQQQGQQVGPGEVPSPPAAAVAVSWRWLEDTLAFEHVGIAAAKAAAEAEAAGSSSQQGAAQRRQHPSNKQSPQQQQQQQQVLSPGPRWLQNEVWRAQQSAASSLDSDTDAPLAGFQKAGEEAEEQLLHAARLLQQAAASERLTEQQYIRVRQKLVVQQRRLARLYSQQQVALSQGHLLLSTAQVGALFSRAEELLPGMAADDLISVLRAAAWLGADVSSAPWRAALRRTLLPAVKSCSAQQLVALLWSLVQLQGYLQPPQRLLMAAVARCEELLAVGQSQTRGGGQTTSGALQPCSCMQLTQMVWALVRLGCGRYIGPRWARTYVAAFSRQLQHMGGRELGVVLRTMVRLRMAVYVPAALLERVELLMETQSAVWPSSCLGLVAAAVVKLQQQQLLARKLAARQQGAVQQAAAQQAAAAAGVKTRRSNVSQGSIRRMKRLAGSSSSGGGGSSRSSSPLRRASSMEQLQAAALRERQLLHVSVAEVLQALAAKGVTTRAGRMAALVQDSRVALEVTVQQQEAAAAAAGAGAAGGLGSGPSVLAVGGAAGVQGAGGAQTPTLVSQELSGVSTLAGGSPGPEGGDMQVVYLAV